MTEAPVAFPKGIRSSPDSRHGSSAHLLSLSANYVRRASPHGLYPPRSILVGETPGGIQRAAHAASQHITA